MSGDYQLYHGDCLEIMKSLPAGCVDAVITDPPYGLDFPYLSYQDTRENLQLLISGFMPEVRRIAKKVLILCGPTQIGLYSQPDWIASVIWNTTGSFGKYGYNQWTPILCYGKDLEGFGSVNGLLKSDTLRINGLGGVGPNRSAEEKKHSCPKPLPMMQAIINRFTQCNYTILDCFMGSGTTGVACLQTGRKFIGIEIDETYFCIAQKRIADAAAQGRLFDSLTTADAESEPEQGALF